MKTFKLTSILFCLILSSNPVLWAQEPVLATAGKHMTANSGQLTWTIGQALAGSATSNSNELITGLHQGEKKGAVVAAISDPLDQIYIYPNPATDFLSIHQASGPYKGSFQLINASGRIILEDSGIDFSQKVTLRMQAYPQGIYVLRISPENHPIQQFKIIKQ